MDKKIKEIEKDVKHKKLGKASKELKTLEHMDKKRDKVCDYGKAMMKKKKKWGYMAKKNWIAGAIKKPGALHKKLHVKKGEKIPASKLEKAEHSKNPTLRKEANLAKTLKSFHKK